MQKKFVEELEKKIKKEKRDLELMLKRIATKDKELAGDFDAKFENFGDEIYDDSAEAAEVSEYDTRLSLEANLETRLKEVNDTLDRIKKGTYGICENCGEKISDSRLAANPTARLCIKCSAREKKRGIYYDGK
jgi:DnaK suppressor protein